MDAELEAAQAINKSINTVIYLEGYILTLAVTPADNFTYESAEGVIYKLGHFEGNNPPVTNLVLTNGVEWSALGAPPKLKPKRTLATTWAAIKK